MTLEEYTTCLNSVGEAGWHLQHASNLAQSPQYGVRTAFELARLALHALIAQVRSQAERDHSFQAALAALGTPLESLEQQECLLREDDPAPYWKIAGPIHR